MRYTLHVLCSTKDCRELVQVDKHDNKEHYCAKCQKKKNYRRKVG